MFIVNVFTSYSQIAESHETRTEQLIVNDNFDLVHKGIQVNKRIGDDSLSQHLQKHNKAVVNVTSIFPVGNRERRRRYLAIQWCFCGFHRNHARQISMLTLQDYQSRMHANILSRTALTLQFHLAIKRSRIDEHIVHIGHPTAVFPWKGQ